MLENCTPMSTAMNYICEENESSRGLKDAQNSSTIQPCFALPECLLILLLFVFFGRVGLLLMALAQYRCKYNNESKAKRTQGSDNSCSMKKRGHKLWSNVGIHILLKNVENCGDLCFKNSS